MVFRKINILRNTGESKYGNIACFAKIASNSVFSFEQCIVLKISVGCIRELFFLLYYNVLYLIENFFLSPIEQFRSFGLLFSGDRIIPDDTLYYSDSVIGSIQEVNICS